MAWETFDDSTMDNAEEENPKADETKFEDAEDDDFSFFGVEVEVPGDCAGMANLSENIMQMQNQNGDEDSDNSCSIRKTFDWTYKSLVGK